MCLVKLENVSKVYRAKDVEFPLLLISLLNGIDKQARDNIVNCQTAHIAIFPAGYFEKKDELPLDNTIKESEDRRIRSRLKELPGIRAYESRLLFAAGLIKGMDELPIMGVGIEPGQDPQLFNTKESLVEGAWLEPGDTGILVGTNLAKDIGLSVGQLVTIRMIISAKENPVWNAVPDLTPEIFIGSIIFGIIIAVAAALYPIFKSSKMSPVRSLS